MRIRMMARWCLAVVFVLVTYAAAQTPASLDGLWRSQGYGLSVRIQGDSFAAFEVTAVSRLFVSSGRIVGRELFILNENDAGMIVTQPIGTIDRVGDQLVVTIMDGTILTFDAIGALPQPPITTLTPDPVANFEVFWNTFEEHFALFPILPRVNWQALYNQYRPQVTSQTSAEELFAIFMEMLTPLRDGHTDIFSPQLQLGFSPAPPPASAWMFARQADIERVLTSYMDGQRLNVAGNGNFRFGVINGSVGYLRITAFAGYSDTGDARVEAAVFGEELDRILAAFQARGALIIDLRINSGGFDNVSLALASRLTDRVRLGFSKQARIGGYTDFAPPTPRQFVPAGVLFLNKPVIVLTSSLAFSAADVAAMVLKSLPQTTLVGETTYGIFSNRFERVLPNQWQLSLSNERYLSVDGIDFEQKGIPPDVEEIPNEAALDAERDNILERALQLLGVQP